MRKINATFQVENELQEGKLWNILLSMSPIDLKLFPDVSHIKDNKTYKKLRKEKKEAQIRLDDFIINNKL